MVRILPAIFATVIIIVGFYNIYEKKLFDSYSLKCTHMEFDNIEKWFMVKKRFASKQPHAIFEEPWHSTKFNKLTKVNDLSFWGTLIEISGRCFRRDSTDIAPSRRTVGAPTREMTVDSRPVSVGPASNMGNES